METAPKKQNLNSEFGRLQKVLMHRPGLEIDRLNPDNLEELLFNDIPYLATMQEEHKAYIRTIRQERNADVYLVNDLLMDILIDKRLALEMFEHILAEKGQKHLAIALLEHFSTAQTSYMLTSGLTVKQAKRHLRSALLEGLEDNDYLIRPKPNLYFTRDPAAFTQGGILMSRMFYPARQAETYLMENIFRHHPYFRNRYNIIDLEDELKPEDTIEGGDVILLSHSALAIGCSERTNANAIAAVAKELIGKGHVERVYQVNLPKKRTCMHLDTVFTMIDENLVVTFLDAMQEINSTKIFEATGQEAPDGRKAVAGKEVKESLIQMLKREIPNLEVVQTAFGNPDYASREQYFDGANVFALAPRKVVAYNRNSHTNRALREAGVEVLEIDSSELSRGLGGPRCMTMSISRKPIYRGMT